MILEAIEIINPDAKAIVYGHDLDTCTIIWGEGTAEISKDDIRAKLSEAEFKIALNDLRMSRNRRLLASDWTQSRDVTLSNDADWKTYRQALRDLPASSTPKLDENFELDLSSVTWPTKPE